MKWDRIPLHNFLQESPPSRRRGLKLGCCNNGMHSPVASFAEAWIEIEIVPVSYFFFIVASFAEAWIEIEIIYEAGLCNASPPSRRRGLKSLEELMGTSDNVASFAEAWIEICWIALVFIAILVASFAEAWIEICKGEIPFQGHSPPPPSRRCGLKYLIVHPTN